MIIFSHTNEGSARMKETQHQRLNLGANYNPESFSVPPGRGFTVDYLGIVYEVDRLVADPR